MIDTIILSIPREKITEITAPIKETSVWKLKSNGEGYEIYVKNPSTSQKKSGYYFPRLTGYRRQEKDTGFKSTVKIEFSIPKLIYTNNLEEVFDTQFEMIVRTLKERIKQLGFTVDEETLINASVSTLHYSKNIILLGGYTSQMVINELHKINLNKRFDLTRARYMNDGQSLCIYSNLHSFIIYDKIADLKRGEKRSIDKDQSYQQRSLFNELKNEEILRLEVRICKKKKINLLFKELSFPTNPTFRNVFSTEKSKSVLLHYWEKFIEKNSMFIFSYAITPHDILKKLAMTLPKAKPKQLLYSVGLLLVAKEGNGLRDARDIIEKRGTSRSWHGLVSETKIIADGLQKIRPRDWYDQVQRGLKEFKPYRILRAYKE